MFKKAAITTIIAAFGTSGAYAQNAPKPIQIPAVLAARFADMAGHWNISGTITAQGKSQVFNGSEDCSLLAGGIALLCTGKDTPNSGVVHLYGYDPVHKKVWSGTVNNYAGAHSLTGAYSAEGFVFPVDSMSVNGTATNGTITLAGKIGSGVMKQTFSITRDGKPYASERLTLVKQK